MAAKYKHAIPPWHDLSHGATGEAAGLVVYADYGTKDNYGKLVAIRCGSYWKIVLARYGANFHGLKVSRRPHELPL